MYGPNAYRCRGHGRTSKWDIPYCFTFPDILLTSHIDRNVSVRILNSFCDLVLRLSYAIFWFTTELSEYIFFIGLPALYSADQLLILLSWFDGTIIFCLSSEVIPAIQTFTISKSQWSMRQWQCGQTTKVLTLYSLTVSLAPLFHITCIEVPMTPNTILVT